MTRTYTGFVSLFDDEDDSAAGMARIALTVDHGGVTIDIKGARRTSRDETLSWLIEQIIPGAADCTGAASDPGCSRTSHHPTSQSAGQDS